MLSDTCSRWGCRLACLMWLIIGLWLGALWGGA